MKKIVAFLAVAALALAPQAHAQDENDAVAYLALTQTHLGAFAPIVSAPMMGAQQTGMTYSLRYGRFDFLGVDENNIGLGLSMPLQQAGTLGFSAGYLMLDCDDCDDAFTIGANFERNLLNAALSPTATANVGLDIGASYSNPFEATALGLAASVPISAVAGTGSWKFVPFIKPGFGWGRLSDEGESESGTRFMFGAGLGMVDDARGIGLNVGMQKVFIDEGEMAFGVGFSWNPKR